MSQVISTWQQIERLLQADSDYTSGFGLTGAYTPTKTFDPATADLATVRDVLATLMESLTKTGQVGGLTPTIVSQPSNVAITALNTATFTVVAAALPVPTYQWQVDSGSGFANISGATSPSYTTGVQTTLNDGDEYRCVITNALGTVTTVPAVMSVVETNLRLLDTTSRVVGDASVALPLNAKMHFQSAGDGQAFAVGSDDFIVMFRMFPFIKPTDSNTVETGDTLIFPVSFGRDVNNHLTIGFRPSTGSPANTMLGIWKVGNSDLVNTTCTIGSGDVANVSGTVPMFLRKTGNVLKFGFLATNEDTGYKLVTAEATGSSSLDLDSIMSTTGRLLVNCRYPGATADGCAVSDLFIGSLPSGTDWSDVALDTDAQIIQALIDPDRVGTYIDEFDEVRSFDLCASGGTRKLLHQRTEITTSDKLVCIHSGLELAASQAASPTATPLGCAPYEPAAQGGSLRANPLCRPLFQKVKDVIVGCLPGGQISQNQDMRIAVLDAATSVRVKPDVLCIPANRYVDSSDSDTVKTLYGWAGRSNWGDNHTQMSCVHDSKNDRLIPVFNLHSEVYDDNPDTGDTLFATGAIGIYNNNGLTITAQPYNGSATTALNAHTYSATHDHTDGNVYIATRAGGTETGQQRLLRIRPDGTIDFQNYTRSAIANPEFCQAAIPESVLPVGDHLVLIAGTRITGSLDYISPMFVVLDPTLYDSSSSGWHQGRTGTNYAATKTLTLTSDPNFYPIPGPGVTALEAFRDSSTPLDPSAWAYGEAPQAAFSDGLYVGIVTRRGSDADRSGDFLKFEQWMLHILTLNETTKALTLQTSFDLTSSMATVAGDYNVGVGSGTDVFDYQFNRLQCVVKDSGELQIYVLKRQGEDIQTESSVGTNAINIGTALGKIVFSDWKNPASPTTTVGPLFEAGDYDGRTIMPFAVRNAGLVLQVMPSGAVVGVDNAPECATIFEAT